MPVMPYHAPMGSYDEKVMLREEMEIEIAKVYRKEEGLKELYNQMAMSMILNHICIFRLNQEDRNER